MSCACVLSDVAGYPNYFDKQYVTQNQAAIARVKELGSKYSLGQTCENALTAVPDW
jgi:hypothetical protein